MKIHNRISKVCALVTATLILPVLAYAGHDNAKGKGDDNDEHRLADHDRCPIKHIPVVPEANPGWVLIPFFGAVLLYSWRAFSRSSIVSAKD